MQIALGPAWVVLGTLWAPSKTGTVGDPQHELARWRTGFETVAYAAHTYAAMQSTRVARPT
eukprot:364527-Chlamydomonas_euryale.AAC.11